MTTSLQQLGKYELQEVLGHGGMAEVWKALDPQLKRYVAIKILGTNLRSDSDFMERFVREAQAIATLRHPNIVQVYDFQVAATDADLPMPYMVMDYVEGQTLATYIENTSRVCKYPSPAELLRLFTPICIAVDYAHQHNMIHRDIKPSNILLDKRNTINIPMGEPILTDFGLVKIMGVTAVTLTGTSLGTPLYISPEQARGYHGNERSDIYSLGTVLYELCTGVTPFQGETAYEIMMQHVHTLPTVPSLINPAIPPALDVVILRCLAKEPEARFQRASSIAAALAEALQLPVPTQISQPVYPIEKAERPTNYETPMAPADKMQPAQQTVQAQEEDIPTHLLTDSNNDVNTPALVNAQPQAAQHIAYAVPFAQGQPDMDMQKPLAVHPFAPQTPQAPSAQPAYPRDLLWRNVVILTLLLLLAASGLDILLRPSTGSASNTSGTGNAFNAGSTTNSPDLVSFISSEQLNSAGMPAINDGVYIHLQNISAPTTGHKYYAWLTDNKVDGTVIPLGALTFANGTATLSYTEPQHADLLKVTSNVLITEESASVAPISPSPDKGTWRFQGGLPQTPSPKDNFSYLDHLRHLLSNEPGLNQMGLPGGVDYWFLTNIEELQKQTMEVRDHANTQFVRQQLANILYYLDGICATQDLQNAPAGAPMQPENPQIAHDSRIPLLKCAQLPPEPPGHVEHIALHLNGLVDAPGSTPAQKKWATQIDNGLNQLRSRLENVRTDAIKLASMSDAQLGQAQALRNDLVLQASEALSGSVDPTTQTQVPSARQICGYIEQLATFDLQQV